MSNSPGSATLADLLAQELGLLHVFVALLRREQSLLAQGAVEQLAALATEKSAIATELGILAGARELELSHRKLPSGRNGMDAWIASPAGAASRHDWQRLLELAAEARALNETSGKLIALHLQHNQQALNVLMAAVDKAVTYGPDGQQRSGGGGRSLGSA